ncbi:MAG: CGNR zinc finger domain-containing protein [Candidatus Dormibacterales bacterium]
MTLPGPLPHDWGATSSLDLINSRWSDHLGSGRYYDRLPDSRFRVAFLKRWSYRVDDPDDASAVSRLHSLRASLRNLLEQYMSGRPLRRATLHGVEAEMNRAPIGLRFRRDRDVYSLSIEHVGSGWDATTSDIAMSAARLISGRATIRVCANPDCSWMFEDATRSKTRRWCNVSVCGSLVNVRRHRANLRLDQPSTETRTRRRSKWSAHAKA